MIYSIYQIQNILDNKVYIGYTSNFERRKQQHIKSSKNKKSKLYNAIRKYGLENFRFDVIYQSKDNIHTKETMEPYFIELFDSIENGYNMTRGGDGFDSETNSYYAKINWSKQDYRDKLTASMKAAQNDPDLKHFHTQHSKELWESKEYREKVTKGVQDYWDDENKKKHSEKLKIVFSTEDQRKRLSENQKKCWEDPYYRENQRIKQSEKWDNPNSKSFQLKGKYIVTTPEGTKEHVIGLKKYCRENHLNSKAMFGLSNGKITYYKGYFVEKVIDFPSQ